MRMLVRICDCDQMTLQKKIEQIYEEYHTLDKIDEMSAYGDRMALESEATLTVYTEQDAQRACKRLLPYIKDQVVVEIGAGVGLLATEMAKYADTVIAIDLFPAWAYCYVTYLHRNHPSNLVYMFGDAKKIRPLDADVAVYLTHSGHETFERLARRHTRRLGWICDYYNEWPEQDEDLHEGGK